MPRKFHSFYTICVLFTVYCSINTLFLQQPQVLGITYQSFSKLNENYSDIPVTESSNSSQLKNVQSFQSEVIKTDHLGYKGENMGIKSKTPDLKTSIKDFNQIIFPSHPSNIPNTSVSLPKLLNSNLNKNCRFEDALVIYDGKCHSLLKQGPCSVNQWLLINEHDAPYCAPRPCQEGELLYNEKCVSISDASVCGVSEVLYIEFSGEVYCDCLPYYYIYDTKARKCFAENDQGSCPDGEFLDIDSNNSLKCIENPCKTDKQVYNPKNKGCYKKGYIGSCKKENGDTIVYIEEDQSALCVNTNNRNFLEIPTIRSCPFGSKRRSQNKCPKPFTRNKDGPRMFRVSSHSGSKHLPCPPGFIEHPGPTCKRPNDLFG